jgi:hypothetical protein
LHEINQKDQTDERDQRDQTDQTDQIHEIDQLCISLCAPPNQIDPPVPFLSLQSSLLITL